MKKEKKSREKNGGETEDGSRVKVGGKVEMSRGRATMYRRLPLYLSRHFKSNFLATLDRSEMSRASPASFLSFSLNGPRIHYWIYRLREIPFYVSLLPTFFFDYFLHPLACRDGFHCD